ncbi:MAG: MoaD/ThiS family protein [Chloroflexi bacterium]|nr:MoaD/ThiS family protein [Chloroflexota bacterium]
MKVTVVYFGDFARFKPADWPGKRGTIELPEGATVDTLAEQLGIGDEPFVVMLDEAQHHRGAELHDGDTVTFLPPIAGGSSSPLSLGNDSASPPPSGGGSTSPLPLGEG